MSAPLFGLILILIGSMMLASELFGIHLWHYVETFWPMVLIIYGLVRFSDKRKSRSSSVFIAFAGAILLAWNLELVVGDVLTILISMFIIALGFHLISGRRNRVSGQSGEGFYSGGSYGSGPYSENPGQEEYSCHGHWSQDQDRSQKGRTSHCSGAQKGPDGGPKVFERIDCDILNDRFVFANDNRRYASDYFSGGELELYFSKVNLDLSSVRPLSNQTLVAARIFFSTLNIKVPKEWAVYVNGKRLYMDDDQEADSFAHVVRIETHITGGEINLVS